jgi:hypothetical protein
MVFVDLNWKMVTCDFLGRESSLAYEKESKQTVLVANSIVNC